MSINPTPETLYPVDQARFIAERSAADDPDWEYRVEPRGPRAAVVAIYDEDGHLAGYM